MSNSKTSTTDSEEPSGGRVTAEKARKETVKKAVAELKRLRRGTTLGGLSWKALRDEGRK